MTTAARDATCTACGHALGRAALELANAAWAERMAYLRDSMTLERHRIVRHLFAICPNCGARYHFDGSTRNFIRLPHE
jgi:hypothetical protein